MTEGPRGGAGRVLAGRYRLRHHLASGGMAEVWEATDEVLDRAVAVKVLHPHLADDPALRDRFRHEAKAAARLVDPTIVAIYDTCDDPGTEAIVMELVNGRTLRQYLDERGRLDPVEVVHIGAEVARALACAHRAGIVHRDVKPANILLSDDGRVLVTDFGIAKVLDEPDLTRTTQLLGTVKYLAPEQVESGPVDARTDVYALGAVLYEALCGEPPFRADNAAALALARLQRDPRPPHDVVAGVPPALEAVVLRALARSPDARYRRADEMRTALLGTRLDLGEPMALADATIATAALPGAAPTPSPIGHAAPPASPAGWGPPPVAPSRRRVGPGVVVSLAVVAALLLVALLVASTSVGRDLFDPDGDSPTDTPTEVALVGLAGAHSFDPLGDGVRGENDELAPAAVDGDPTTSWRTETYFTRDFGRLKDGVGLVVDLGEPTTVSRVAISSPTTGWSMRAHLSDVDGATLDAWGPPVAEADGIDDTGAALDLGGAEGRYLLVWITDLGNGAAHRVEISEVVVGS